MKKLVGFDPVTGQPKYEEVIENNNQDTEASGTVNVTEEKSNVNLQKNAEASETVNVTEEKSNVNLQKNTETSETVNVTEEKLNVNLQKNVEPAAQNFVNNHVQDNAQLSGFDPMTGKPLGQNNAQPAGFDPMTGKPLGQNNAQPVGFDPMTGKPLGQNNTQPAGFDPMTGKPLGQADIFPKKKKKKAPIILACVVIAVILGVVGFATGIFMSNTDKVLLAISNTINQKSNMVKAIENINILGTDKYVIDMGIDVEGVALDVQFVKKDSDKQISGTVSADEIKGVEFTAGITDSELKFEVPDVSDYLFVYNYKKEKDGYLTETIDDDDIEAFDKVAEYIYSNDSYDKIEKEVKKIALKGIRKIDAKAIKNKEFEINGKDKSCKGYKVTISGDDIEDIFKDIEKYLEEEHKDLYDTADLDSGFSDIYDDLDEMKDVDFKFYIYKNKLACINMSVDKQELSILFTGCEKGMHNIEIEQNGNKLLELEGEADGSEETYTLLQNDREVFVMEYDSKSGDFEVSANNDAYVIEGNLKSSSKEFAFALEKVNVGYYALENIFEMNIKSGGSMKKYEGEKFDIGNASDDDFKDMIEDIDYKALGYDSYESFVRDLMY